MKGRLSQVLIHIAGCVTFLALPIVFSPDASSLSDLWRHPPAMKDFLVYLALLLFFYFNYFWLIPNYYFKRKYGGLSIITILCFVAIVLVPNLLIGFRGGPNRAGYEWPANNPIPLPSDRPPRQFNPSPTPPPADSIPSFGQESPPPTGRPFPPPDRFHGPGQHEEVSRSLLLDVSHQLFLFLAVFFFSLILKISYRWRLTEKEKLNAELSYLKAQINPHFLFNILNTIYSLAIEKSDQTGTAVVKLSQMMRYVISDAGNHLVPLSREIDYLSNYIELQKLRFGDSIPLSFTVTGKATGQLIAPLILISFVENAFKHGVNAAENTDIRITVNIDEKQLYFKAFNNKVTVLEVQETTGGLGIENTQKRLQLLYPGSHTLLIRDEEHYFEVSLLLQLT
ncbi:sensor histidine kinase [Chitinophaga filiformis]|uniref:Histidine kinase n=1 Tax=Chitinophaga filiformis TaxID=104663 RepID=A0A1G7U4Y9_CHIFI|nr:sensor histidine kinase [Chitinophaga filiformis]SDG42695.1 Histidine kinase [Chitinophaga filiformis]